MNVTWSNIRYLIVQTYREWSEDKASQLAAAMSYYTIFSLAPLLILAVVIAGQLFDVQVVKEAVETQISSVVGMPGAAVVGEILNSASQPGGSLIATVVSVATLLLGASGVFGQLQRTLNTIWGVIPDPDRGWVALLKDRFFSLTMVAGVGFLLLVSTVISAVLAAVGEYFSGSFSELLPLYSLINLVISLVVTTVLFALVFKIVPDVKISWNDVWIGAAVTALLFTVGKYLIGLYLGQTAANSTYGAFGSLIALLAWVYYSSQILFMGAEFTQVYANRFGSRIVAAEGAIALENSQIAGPAGED